MLFYSLANFSQMVLTVNHWGAAAQCGYEAISLWPRKHKKVTWGLEVVYIDKPPTAVDFNGRTLYYRPFLVLSSKSGRFGIHLITVWSLKHFKRKNVILAWKLVGGIPMEFKVFLSMATPSVASHNFFSIDKPTHPVNPNFALLF